MLMQVNMGPEGIGKAFIKGVTQFYNGLRRGFAAFEGDQALRDELSFDNEFFLSPEVGPRISFKTPGERQRDVAKTFIESREEMEALPGPSAFTEVALKKAEEGDFRGMLTALAADPVGTLGFLVGESIGRGPGETLTSFVPVAGTFAASMSAEQRAGFANELSSTMIEAGLDPSSEEDLVEVLGQRDVLKDVLGKASKGAGALATTETALELLSFGLARKLIPSPVVRSLVELGSETLGESAGEVSRQVAVGEDVNLASAFLEGAAAFGQSLATTIGQEGLSLKKEASIEPLSSEEQGEIEVESPLVEEERSSEEQRLEDPLVQEAAELFDQELAKPFEEQDPETFQSAAQVLREGVPLVTPEDVAEASVQVIQPEIPEDVVGLSAQENEWLRERNELGTFDAESTRQFSESFQKAKTLYGERVTEEALLLAQSITQSPRPVADYEHAALVLGLANIDKQLDEVSNQLDLAIQENNVDARTSLSARREALLAQEELLSRAGDQSGREAARAFNLRKAVVNKRTYEIGTVLREARIQKGSELTEEQSNKYIQKVQELKKAQRDLDALMAKADTRLLEEERARAQEEFQREISEEVKQQNISEILAEREEIKQELRQLGLRALSSITGLDPEALWTLGKFARNIIKEQKVKNLDELVGKVQESMPFIKPGDVYVALNSQNPNKKTRAVNEAEARLRLLKKQARLMELLENELSAKTLEELQTVLYNTASQEEFKEAMDIIHQLREAILRGESVESFEAEIKDLKQLSRIREKEASLQEQIKTGVFETPPEKEPKKRTAFSKDLEAAEIRVQLLKRDIQRDILSEAPLFDANSSLGKKVLQSGLEGIRLSRMLLATGDMSSFLRQGLWVTAGHPVIASKAMLQGAKAYFSRTSAEATDLAIRTHPNHWLREKSGLYVAPLEVGLDSREELFMSKLMAKLPFLSELIASDLGISKKVVLAGPAAVKSVAARAERVFVTHLNLLRVGLFDKFVEANPGATDEQLELYAKYLNAATGRGNIRSDIAAGLSTVLFAPRFAVSRFETPARALQLAKDPTLRKEVVRDMTSFVGLGLTTLALAGLSGLEVGSDPEDSDFGKIIVDNTRFDIWGGFQQPASLIARLTTFGLDRAGIRELQRKVDPYDLAARFVWYKSAPSVTLPFAVGTGKSVTGQPITPAKALMESFTPLFIQDVLDAAKKEGLSRAVITGPAAFVGIGSSTFGTEMKAGDMKKLLLEAKMKQAPRPPKYFEVIREDIQLKESLDEAFDAILAKRLRLQRHLIDELDSPGAKETFIRRQAEITRRAFNQYRERRAGVGPDVAPEVDLKDLVQQQEALIEEQL